MTALRDYAKKLYEQDIVNYNICKEQSYFQKFIKNKNLII